MPFNLQHIMNKYRKGVSESYLQKGQDCYSPLRQAVDLTEICEVSILMPITTEAAFYVYPGLHVVVLYGENLSFCRKICLGDKEEVKTPAKDVSPRMIQLSLKPSDETKALISKAGTVNVKLCSHFAKAITLAVPVKKVRFSIFTYTHVYILTTPYSFTWHT